MNKALPKGFLDSQVRLYDYTILQEVKESLYYYKDYDTENFKTYSKRIKNDVSFLINNLCAKYHYTQQSAKEVCMYVIDRDLSKTFAGGSLCWSTGVWELWRIGILPGVQSRLCFVAEQRHA